MSAKCRLLRLFLGFDIVLQLYSEALINVFIFLTLHHPYGRNV